MKGVWETADELLCDVDVLLFKMLNAFHFSPLSPLFCVPVGSVKSLFCKMTALGG